MASKAITVDLGDMAASAHRYVEDGRYETISDVVKAGLRALDREEAELDDLIREKVAESLADPRPGVPMHVAFARLDEAKAQRRK